MVCSAHHQFLLLVIPFYTNPQQNASCVSLKDDYLKPGKHGMDLSLPANRSFTGLEEGSRR